MAHYRGRIAPTPTGYLHLGHARTFWIAAQRCANANGALVLRNEDLDPDRCKPHFVAAMIEDLKWLGLKWQEGPDCGGAFAPYVQSQRREHYLRAWQRLRDSGFIYPCTCSRKDLADAARAPHDDEDEPIYPGTCRTKVDSAREYSSPDGVNWRFRVPDGEAVVFTDLRQGPQSFICGNDFGDFLVWAKNGTPAYQLAVMVDDAAMQITEVVRGADLLKSTARQILIARALEVPVPDYYHCPVMTDERGVRLAKRHDALSLRRLRESGVLAESLREAWEEEMGAR